MLRLRRDRGNMPFTFGRLLRGARSGRYSARAAVVADAIVGIVVHHSDVVDVVNVSHVDIVHRAVVIELSVVPAPAFVAVTKVAPPVVDAAVEPNCRAPVASVEDISATAPTPPRRSPEITHLGSQNPRSRNPVVIAEIRIPRPIAGNPDVSGGRANGLCVYWQGRWPKRNRYSDLTERCHRHRND